MSTESNIYFSELERLKTFRENGWPHSFLSPEIMAKCGFYYTGIADQVKCPFCDIVIFYWDDAAEPIDEHIFASKNCRFVNGYDVGNIFIGNDPREIFELSPKEEVETKKILSNNEKKRLRKKKKMDEQSSRLNEVTDLMIRQMFEDDIDIDIIADLVPKDSWHYEYIRVYQKLSLTFDKDGSKDLENLRNDNEIVDPAKKMLEGKKPVELESKEDDEEIKPVYWKKRVAQLTRLRKRKIETNENATLPTIIPEKKTKKIDKEMMESTHMHDVTGSCKERQGVEVVLDPNDLKMLVADLITKCEKLEQASS